MGRKSRTKGRLGEQELVNLAIECGFRHARRGSPMQAAGADGLADVDGIPALWAEAKRYRRTPVARLLAELLATDRPEHVTALFWRDDGREWRAALDARAFLRLYRELHELRSAVRGLRCEVERAKGLDVER